MLFPTSFSMKFLVRDALKLLRKEHTRIEPCCWAWVTGHPPGLLARLRTTTHEIWKNNIFILIMWINNFLYLKTVVHRHPKTQEKLSLFSPKANCYKAWSAGSDELFLRTQKYLPVFTENPCPVFIQRPGQTQPPPLFTWRLQHRQNSPSISGDLGVL